MFSAQDVFCPMEKGSYPTRNQLFPQVRPLLYQLAWQVGIIVTAVQDYRFPFFPSSLHNTFLVLCKRAIKEEASSTIPAHLLCVCQSMCGVSSAVGFCNLVLVSNQEEWREPVLYWGPCYISLAVTSWSSTPQLAQDSHVINNYSRRSTSMKNTHS